MVLFTIVKIQNSTQYSPWNLKLSWTIVTTFCERKQYMRTRSIHMQERQKKQELRKFCAKYGITWMFCSASLLAIFGEALLPPFSFTKQKCERETSHVKLRPCSARGEKRRGGRRRCHRRPRPR